MSAPRQSLGAGKPELRDGDVGLVSRVPHADERAGKHPDDHQAHHALEVDGVTNVGGGARHVSRGVEERVEHLVDGREALETAALLEERFHLVQKLSKGSHQPFFSIRSKLVLRYAP